MKHKRTWIVIGSLLALIVAIGGTMIADAQGPITNNKRTPNANAGTAFMYQGQLKKNGVAVNVICNFQFDLFADSGASTRIGNIQNTSALLVNGLFTATIDFGVNAFTGDARWLRTAVQCPPDSGLTTLSLQPITPAPMALALPGLYTQQNATSPNLIGGYSGNIISATVVAGTISGGGDNGSPNKVWNNYATIGGGRGNLASGDHTTIGGGYGNKALGNSGTIGGGVQNTVTVQALYATVSGGNLNTASGNYTVIGGGQNNLAINNYATVGGGLNNAANQVATVSGGSNNHATGNNSTIGGGTGNNAQDSNDTIGGGIGNNTTGLFATIGGGSNNNAVGAATIGGGQDNTANGGYATIGGGGSNTANGGDATIGGGYGNIASGNGSVVGGGGGYFNLTVVSNTASAPWATVGGGAKNTASGTGATVPGGNGNLAGGENSFAAGTQSRVSHNGTFVWADDNYVDFNSTTVNQFLVRAANGVGINTNSTTANALTVNGKIIAGGTGAPIGSSEPFVAHGSGSGISLDDRAGGANPRWVMYPNNGSLYFYNTTWSDVVSINSSGKLTAAGGFSGQCLNGSNFNTTASSSCNMDFAESFQSVELTAPGDLVALVNTPNSAPTVRKSNGAYEDLTIGVVSQNPGLVFDNGATRMAGDNSQLITSDKTIVALVGRVPVKVSMDNGVIAIGDPLTSSSIPGRAMKATHAGKIIGYAMEATTTDGLALALIQPGYYLPAEQIDAQKQIADLETRLAAVEQNANATNNLNVFAFGILLIGAVMVYRKRKGG